MSELSVLHRLWEAPDLTDVFVIVEHIAFKLNRFPLAVKSKYFRARFNRTWHSKEESDKYSTVELKKLAGGSRVFEIVARHCYGFNVLGYESQECNCDNFENTFPELLCAADFLGMEEDGNLLVLAMERLQSFLQGPVSSKLLHKTLTVLLKSLTIELRAACCAISGLHKLLYVATAELLVNTLTLPERAAENLLKLNSSDFLELMSHIEEIYVQSEDRRKKGIRSILSNLSLAYFLSKNTCEEITCFKTGERIKILRLFANSSDSLKADKVIELLSSLNIEYLKKSVFFCLKSESVCNTNDEQCLYPRLYSSRMKCAFGKGVSHMQKNSPFEMHLKRRKLQSAIEEDRTALEPTYEEYKEEVGASLEEIEEQWKVFGLVCVVAGRHLKTLYAEQLIKLKLHPLIIRCMWEEALRTGMW
eukprot:CAMPEP_0177585842 /NCGR_PEP_ID=MMETSP0419_2-20121207/4732_1 /TAXON_ID=582737 /ORGANISM="Tetraselmis sp., Strain GSL018" /LENGTH=418 /DNA_ID=CAMNT_0019075649 /DNA_START=71 /DNA_END=1324 /DNA_ORIENTATION=+